MANFKDIKGFHVQSLSQDPAASKIAGGSWASAPSINSGRNAVGGSRGGSQTATMIFGGESATAQTALTEEFDGSSWSEEADLATARRAGGGFGTTAAALFSGGVTDTSHLISTNAVESWNGSAWSETTEMGTPRYSGFNAGIATAGIISSGISRPGSPPGSPITYRTLTETWNGSAWSETGDINVGRYDGGGTGTTTSMLAVGGSGFPPAPGTHASVESFNGSSWTEITDLNTARSKATGAGDTTAALMAGGSPGAKANTEYWDGTTWTEVADLATARASNDSGAGTTTAMIIASGTPPGTLTATEEFDALSTLAKLSEGQVYCNTPANAFKLTTYNIPAGTFSAGGDMSQKRYNISGCGVQNAALVAGGDTYNDSPRSTADSETYNGTAWTEGNDLNETYQGSRQAGTSTASLFVSANSPYATETYNGTSWSDNPSTLSTPRGGPGGLGGVLTAALYCGGYPSSALVEEFNGSSWSEQPDMNTSRWTNATIGTTTAMMTTGGDTPPYSALTETYDGTSWTEVGDQPIARAEMGMAGSAGNAVVAGGSGPPSIGPSGLSSGANSLVFWNGTSWALGPAGYPIQGRGNGGCGTASSGLFMGGIGTPNDTVVTTNEFDAGLANLTITLG